MCGIVGYAGLDPIPEDLLEKMSATLAHRGPDDSGSWIAPDRTVGYAHRRLAILDLSPGGHQPMADDAGRIHLAFNGEIYNHLDLRAELEADGFTFRSRSDTEVVIQAYRRWGEPFVERLNGMFVLALHDADRGEVFLARDRAGEKPLFLWRSPRRVVFASELKALFAFPDFPRRLAPEAVEHYFAYGYVPRDLCILDAVVKLAPGHIACFRPETGEWHERAYWDLPESAPDPRASAEDLEHELERLLEDAVRRQLATSDVPVAVLLSGGIDSSLITAMAARARTNVKTFTVTFPLHQAFDEAPYARLVARHFGTDHQELTGDEPGIDLLPRLARQFDEPIADSSMIPTYLVSALVREHATVALGGDGGDELFGGYRHYTFVQRLARVRGSVPPALRKFVGLTAARMPARLRGRTYLASVNRAEEAAVHSNGYFDPAARRALLAAPSNGFRTPEELRATFGYGAHSLLQTAQRADFRSYLPDDILVKVDRASMLASVEVRAPFLDHRVIELAFGRVPDTLKADAQGGRKLLLRRLAARLLPPELDLQRKQGFALPVEGWLRGRHAGYVRDLLAEADPRLFRRETVAELVNAGPVHQLYALVMFELWRRAYDVTL
jgi:asparagine synthase (glutamine-hydrolysing)